MFRSRRMHAIDASPRIDGRRPEQIGTGPSTALSKGDVMDRARRPHKCQHCAQRCVACEPRQWSRSRSRRQCSNHDASGAFAEIQFTGRCTGKQGLHARKARGNPLASRGNIWLRGQRIRLRANRQDVSGIACRRISVPTSLLALPEACGIPRRTCAWRSKDTPSNAEAGRRLRSALYSTNRTPGRLAW